MGPTTLTSRFKPPSKKDAERLSALKSRIARAQRGLRQFVKPERSLVDELIVERREAAKEE